MPRKSVTEKSVVVSTGGAAAAPARRRAPASKRTPRTVIPAANTIAAAPSHEAIAQLAYSYWEARGCQGGSPDEDWLRAEQALRD